MKNRLIYSEVTIINHPFPGDAFKKSGRCKGPFVKAVCDDLLKLVSWAKEHGISASWIHQSRRGVYHIDLWGSAIRKAKTR